MRLFKAFRLGLALAFAAASARAQVEVRLGVAETPLFVPALSAAVLPSPAAGLTPSLASALAPALAPAAAAPAFSALAAPAVAQAPAPASAAPLILSAGRESALPAATASADPLLEAGNYAAYFDGAAAGVEGEPVYPRLAASARPSLPSPLQAAVARRAVERALPALRASVALGSWNGPDTTLDESCCGDAAPKLAALLRARGVPARLVEAEFHYYVILDLPEGQLIVDPTVRQFFGKKGAPRGVPTVFVGTIGELNDLFVRFKAAKTTRYDPSRIYFSQAVTREERLRAVAADIRRGGPRDLEPLRRELGLPPTAAPAASPSRLIVP